MSYKIKEIEKSQAEKMFYNFQYRKENSQKLIELSVLYFNGKFFDVTEIEPMDIAEFIQTERYKELEDIEYLGSQNFYVF